MEEKTAVLPAADARPGFRVSAVLRMGGCRVSIVLRLISACGGHVISNMTKRLWARRVLLFELMVMSDDSKVMVVRES